MGRSSGLNLFGGSGLHIGLSCSLRAWPAWPRRSQNPRLWARWFFMCNSMWAVMIRCFPLKGRVCVQVTSYHLCKKNTSVPTHFLQCCVNFFLLRASCALLCFCMKLRTSVHLSKSLCAHLVFIGLTKLTSSFLLPFFDLRFSEVDRLCCYSSWLARAGFILRTGHSGHFLKAPYDPKPYITVMGFPTLLPPSIPPLLRQITMSLGWNLRQFDGVKSKGSFWECSSRQ